MSMGRAIWSCFLVGVLGTIAVLVIIAVAWGVVLFIQRGAGTHLPDPEVPSMSINDDSRDPMRPTD